MTSTTYYPQTNEILNHLQSIGFSNDEAQNIMAWWSPEEHGDWLMTASAEDIRDASEDALN